MKRVTIQYFGQLREQAGCRDEQHETNVATCAELFAELATRHGFTLSATACRPAVNHAIAGPASPIADGDTVAFLPPLAGG